MTKPPWTADRPFSLRGGDLAVLTSTRDRLLQLQLLGWPDGGLPSLRHPPIQLSASPLAVDQDESLVAVLSGGDEPGSPVPLTVALIDKVSGQHRDLEIRTEPSEAMGGDIVLRNGRAWIAQIYRPQASPGQIKLRILSLDLTGPLPGAPVPVWTTTWPTSSEPQTPLYPPLLRASPQGDVLALGWEQEPLRLFALWQEGLQLQAQVPLPTWARDFTFNSAGDDIMIGGYDWGLLELHRPAAGWEALPAAPPSATPVATVQSPPSRTPASPAIGLPVRVWLPLLRRDWQVGR